MCRDLRNGTGHEVRFRFMCWQHPAVGVQEIQVGRWSNGRWESMAGDISAISINQLKFYQIFVVVFSAMVLTWSSR